MGELLSYVADSQLLLWTGTGELPVRPEILRRIQEEFSVLGFGERVGYDAQVARTCCHSAGSHAIDCTFFWSRWSRWLFCRPLTCCCAPLPALGAAYGREKLGAERASGERTPLVIERDDGVRLPNPAPHVTRSESSAGSSRSSC